MLKDAANDTVNRLAELLSGGVMFYNSLVVREQQERDDQHASSPSP